MAGRIELIELAKSYGSVPAVQGIDLEIQPGEFFSLLGPSGCGKTTTLRMIAGFERPTAGRILIDGRDLVTVPPHRRPVNTVFQDYALFPFLDVRRNVAFGLRYQRLSKAEVRKRVDDALALVRMSDFADRRPAQLSGGQQQRVALARSLVLNPAVLLLDEPLGALDAKLRKELQGELRNLQRSVGITFVYVTHDQEEALTMSDRLALLSHGRIEQVGTPEEVYAKPVNAYVAGFLGSANVLDVEILGADGDCRVGGASLSLAGLDDPAPGPAKIIVRPEHVTIAPARNGDPVTGLVDRVAFLGPTTQVAVRLADGQTLLAAVPNPAGPRTEEYSQGTPVTATVADGAARLLH